MSRLLPCFPASLLPCFPASLLPLLRKIILIAIAITFLTNCLIGQDRSNGLSELVHEGLGQGSDVRGTVYSVAINESTRQRPQEVVLTGLLPGKTNRVNFRLKNDCDDLVNFEKVTVSCGCMVVKQFNSTLAVGAESDFELEIRLGSGSGSERREIRFDAANGKVWSLRIVCQPVKIFVLNPKVFDVGMEDTHEVRFLKIDYDESAISSGLITENNGSVTCSAGGVMAQDVKVTKGETGVEIALTPDWVRFGLKRTVTEFLEIDHVNFGFDL